MCKLCHWRSFCLAQLKAMDDLSLILELGRSKRDVMFARFKNMGDLANSDLNAFIQRILDYNEDDCIATWVLLDAVQSLSITK